MGSKVGRQSGEKLETRKSKRAKKIIRKHYQLFGGSLTATQCFSIAGVTKSTFYRYLEEMRKEDEAKGIFWNDEIAAEQIDGKKSNEKEIIEEIKKSKQKAHK